VLRIGDLRWRPLVVGVSKLLDDARSLIVVTPSDIKVLRVSGSADSGGDPRSEVARTAGDGGTAAGPAPYGADGLAPGSASGIKEAYSEAGIELDDETLAAIKAQEEGHPPLPSTAETVDNAETVAEAGMRVVRRSKPNGRAGHAETCGRCRGQGRIRIIEEGGAAGEAPCGVCQGSGVIQRYGSRR
jgi:hypothetical protein